jgi:hypothetical protein
VPRLTLVLRDLYPASLSDAARSALPRLPRLEQWLARGDIERAAGDWRQWLQRRARDESLHATPPASVAAAAIASVPEAAPVWLASPVHLVAGLDTVRVHPAGLLQLSGEEQRALAQDFTKVFAGSGWSLHATGRRELLLAGGSAAAAGAVRSHDPALWLGADPRAGLPAGRGADALRRLGSELEMWLHEHPVNRARQARGTLSANALWIWGGGAPMITNRRSAMPNAADTARAWANDVFVDGLAQLQGYTLAPLPERWPQARSAERAPPADLLAVCELGAEPGERALQALESNWIAPALEHWSRGPWRSATLWAGARAVTLTRSPLRSLWRGLRRTRPWWESLLQC